MLRSCVQGAAYTNGCVDPPQECWVPESQSLRTCRPSPTCTNPEGDAGKVFPSEVACCEVMWQGGCSVSQEQARVQRGGQSCWVRGAFYPARQCMESYTLCEVTTPMPPPRRCRYVASSL